ncbi:hypothetical protein PGH47_00010 [Streptomyces sp. HUAS 31]|nr:hypothetical protein [Streptomyces sp. HUAS 31]WCD94131.1 hypothetical protein PGH47_00010 [Streptomyces sp. HUAS 31]
MTCSNWSSCRLYEVVSAIRAQVPVSERTGAQRREGPLLLSRLRGATVA